METHEYLVFTLLDTDHQWLFRTSEGEQAVPVSGRFCSNNADTILHTAVDGVGLILAPWMHVRDHVVAGDLKIVLEKFEIPPAPLHVLFPHARLLSPKVRVFTDLLTEYLTHREQSYLAA